VRALVLVLAAGCGGHAVAASPVDNQAPAGPIVILFENVTRATVIGCGAPGAIETELAACAGQLAPGDELARPDGGTRTIGATVPGLEGDEQAFAIVGARAPARAVDRTSYPLLVWPPEAASRVRLAAAPPADLDVDGVRAGVMAWWAKTHDPIDDSEPGEPPTVTIERVLLADLDGDGHAEPVVNVRLFATAGAILTPGADGGWQVLHGFDWADIDATAAVDLDGDGRDELVIASSYNEGESVGLQHLVAPDPDDPQRLQLGGLSGWGWGE
jgi:hypothetical protein